MVLKEILIKLRTINLGHYVFRINDTIKLQFMRVVFINACYFLWIDEKVLFRLFIWVLNISGLKNLTKLFSEQRKENEKMSNLDRTIFQMYLKWDCIKNIHIRAENRRFSLNNLVFLSKFDRWTKILNHHWYFESRHQNQKSLKCVIARRIRTKINNLVASSPGILAIHF